MWFKALGNILRSQRAGAPIEIKAMIHLLQIQMILNGLLATRSPTGWPRGQTLASFDQLSRAFPLPKKGVMDVLNTEPLPVIPGSEIDPRTWLDVTE
jgi:hypothetical protein